MKIAKCPHCGAGLDISAVPPGSAVACGGCGEPFWIAAGVVDPPPATSPAAPVPRTASSPERPAARTSPRRRPGSPAGRRNPMPLLLGFAGTVAVVVFGLAWILLSGRGREAAPAPASPSAVSSPPPATRAGVASAQAPRAGPRTPLEQRAEDAGLDGPKYVAMVIARAAQGPDAAKASWEELKGLGLDDKAVLALVEGRKAYPHDPWINGKLGLKDRTGDIQKAAADPGMQDHLADFPDYQRIIELSDAVRAKSGSGWLDDAGSAKLDGWLRTCGERLAWLQDPLNERTERLLSNLRYDPAFSKLTFDALLERPYTVFVEEAEQGRREAVRTAAVRAGKALLGGYGSFLALLRKDMGLPDAPRLEEENDTRLRVFCFRDRRSFDRWHAEAGVKPPLRGGIGYFSTRYRMILCQPEGDPAAPSPVEGLEPDTGAFLHVGFHQLYDWYQRFYCGRAGKNLPEDNGALSAMRTTPDELFWFQEGMADYFTAARPVPGREGEWEPGQPFGAHLDRIAQARSRHQEWKAGDLLFADLSELLDSAERKNWGRRGSADLESLVFAQGWSLVHYLMQGDGGKWRRGLLEYARRDIRGERLRSKVGELSKDLPGLAEVLKGDPDLAAEMRSRKDVVVALAELLQRTPELARRLRTRDLLDAFGLPKDPSDPRVTAWIGEVDAGWRRHLDALLAGRK